MAKEPKELYANRKTLHSLLAHAYAGKKILAKCASEQHIKAYCGVIVHEIYTKLINGTIKSLPSGFTSVYLWNKGQITFHDRDLLTNEYHEYRKYVKVNLIPKKLKS